MPSLCVQLKEVRSSEKVIEIESEREREMDINKSGTFQVLTRVNGSRAFCGQSF